MRDFRKINAWERSHLLALEVYKATRQFPKEERYGLVSQMRRASTSIPMNIAEGCGRTSSAELCRFFEISLGSANELEYQFILSSDLGYLNKEKASVLIQEINEIKKMLVGYVKKAKS